MVGMLVSNQQGVQGIPIGTEGGQSAVQFPGGQPGIDQHAAIAAFDINGISLTAAGQQTNPQQIPQSVIYLSNLPNPTPAKILTGNPAHLEIHRLLRRSFHNTMGHKAQPGNCPAAKAVDGP
jgi:hypothetical protein